ncbi:MAG: phosphoribosylformimino-5-aminoimidazole carboxamide ribotide isomerase [Dorea sp.]|nr:phosphoribosylformimino-5-aminoimidazole carboxamide ribotide isomerase [Dorea sp.]
MKFRPCIDIHNGKVKQIVGGSLKDKGNQAKENFTSVHSADYYAEMYKRDGLLGGHVILLNSPQSEYYESTRRQAEKALRAYPGGLQAGGGIHEGNAESFLALGASHVIVTSYVFKDGQIRWENLERLQRAVGREHIVVDLSCRRREGAYYIVTDRWQKFTDVELSTGILEQLSSYCDEFLVHGVDVEGRSCGVDENLAALLGGYEGRPVTYAGGIAGFEDLTRFKEVTGGRTDFTIGSALDIFGGKLSYDKVKSFV